ncbi:MAG TPA: cytochrome c biogenesis protein CcsA [Gemmatimonadaceae bacterium]
MIALAHLIALAFYVGAALLAATPFVRPIGAPFRGVVGMLGAGVAAHLAGLLAFVAAAGQLPLTGLGPSLSSAGFVLAATLLVVELLARDVSLSLLAAPLAALPTLFATVLGMTPGADQPGLRGFWLGSHIALSFVGIAAFGTAGAAGALYLIERRQLRSRRFGAILRFFPPLATLDRVNHVSALAGWVSLTLGIVLAIAYSLAYRETNLAQILWGTGAWIGVSGIALGRVVGGWQARRAALYSSMTFAGVLVLYVALRVVVTGQHGKFL